MASKSSPEFSKYVYYHPEAIPFQKVDEFDAKLIRAAGFDPADLDIVMGVLTRPWNSHPTGALIISEAPKKGNHFAIRIDS